MTNQQPNEQVTKKEASENHEEEAKPANESEERAELKRINEEIRATREKLMDLKKRRQEIKMKLKPRKGKDGKNVKCDPSKKQGPQENDEWGPYSPEFCQRGPPPFEPHYWRHGPPPIFNGYGPWCFRRHSHLKQKHSKHCNPNEQEQFQPYFPPEMNLPPEYPMPPMKQHPHKPHKHPQYPDQCETEEQPKGRKAEGPNQFRKERKGHHHFYGQRYQMPPEWIYYQQQYQQGCQEDESSSYSYSSSSSGSDNEGRQPHERFGPPGNQANPNMWGPPM